MQFVLKWVHISVFWDIQSLWSWEILILLTTLTHTHTHTKWVGHIPVSLCLSLLGRNVFGIWGRGRGVRISDSRRIVLNSYTFFLELQNVLGNLSEFKAQRFLTQPTLTRDSHTVLMPCSLHEDGDVCECVIKTTMIRGGLKQQEVSETRLFVLLVQPAWMEQVTRD